MFRCLCLGLKISSLLCVFFLSGVFGQDTSKSKAEIWKERTSPNKHHQRLSILEGNWDCTLVLFHRDGKEKAQYQGKSTKSFVLGGRFLQDHLRIELAEKQKMEAYLTFGYNNHTGQYEYSWLSNSDTPIVTGTGISDPEGKIYTFSSTYEDSLNNLTYEVREVIEIKSKEQHLYETYYTDPWGREFLKERILFEKILPSKELTPPLSEIKTSSLELKTDSHLVLRLLPGQDLKKVLQEKTQQYQIKAGIVQTCVGSLQKVALRLANAKEPTYLEGKYEIVSLVGTLSLDGLHLHLSLSDNKGNTIGGHVLEGNLIYTTGEIVIGILPGIEFKRQLEVKTGYRELNVYPKKGEIKEKEKRKTQL